MNGPWLLSSEDRLDCLSDTWHCSEDVPDWDSGRPPLIPSEGAPGSISFGFTGRDIVVPASFSAV
eukprot:8388663-Karenia_brevis.AAC.1